VRCSSTLRLFGTNRLKEGAMWHMQPTIEQQCILCVCIVLQVQWCHTTVVAITWHVFCDVRWYHTTIVGSGHLTCFL
jgi:hypothetical protein